MAIKPPSTLLQGPIGTGKTYSVATLGLAGLEVFVIITEPNGLDSLLDAWKKAQLDLSRLHWAVISPAAPGWDALLEMANTAATKGYEDIQKIKTGVGKQHTRQFTSLLEACNNFVDQNGQSFGDVASWGDDRALVIDSLSGVNAIIMNQTIGYKPSAHMGEWGTAMNMQLHFIQKLTGDCQCFLVFLAHVDKEVSELTGLSSITVKALGKKNAPEVLKFFSEVVYTKRENGQFLWSTEEFNTDTKQRGLPLSSKIPPDFRQLVEIHRARKLAAGEGTPAS